VIRGERLGDDECRRTCGDDGRVADDDTARAALERGADKGVAVEILAAQGDVEFTRFEHPRIGRDRRRLRQAFAIENDGSRSLDERREG